MPIGAHVSTVGGIWNAPERAAAIGCDCFQIFTRPPQGGAAPPLTEDVTRRFRTACAAHNQKLWVVHTPYYINLASAEPRIREASTRVIREDLERASLLGAQYLMTHLGSARDVGEKRGRALVIEGLLKILDDYRGSTEFLIEISAGAGAIIGDTFEEIAEIIRAVETRKRRGGFYTRPREDVKSSPTPALDNEKDEHIGVCFDTQHVFASGYDLRTPAAVAETLAQFDRTIGLNRLKMSHINDSKIELGEHKDRHEHIGRGLIGADGIRAVVSHPAFRDLPLILETEDDGREEDVRLLKEFRGAAR
ncbi:MAG: deoxyribonuclease IV [Candidatus Uhrbacteria bacterium]